VERLALAEGFQEYCAALPTWMTYSANRGKNSPCYQPGYFMFLYRSRHKSGASPNAPMRYALPGERPPSLLPPGAKDQVIERFDLYAAHLRRSGRTHG
jgi:hypothetical protein